MVARSLRSLDRRRRAQTFAARDHLFFCLKGMHVLPGQKGFVCVRLRWSAANLCFYSNNTDEYIEYFEDWNLSLTPKLGKKGRFAKVSCA